MTTGANEIPLALLDEIARVFMLYGERRRVSLNRERRTLILYVLNTRGEPIEVFCVQNRSRTDVTIAFPEAIATFVGRPWSEIVEGQNDARDGEVEIREARLERLDADMRGEPLPDDWKADE